MEQKNNDKKTNTTLVIIIVILLILIILLSTGVINFKSDKYDNYEPNNEVTNNNDNKQNDEKEENTDNTEENGDNNNTEVNEVEDLSEYWLVNDDILTQEKTTDLTFKITDNGKISINNSKNIDNITNAKSIKLFSPPAPDSILYILTKDGKLYKYESSEYENGNYTATKMDNYSNIENILTYQKRSTEPKGGCDYIFVADKNGKHYELDSFCV